MTDTGEIPMTSRRVKLEECRVCQKGESFGTDWIMKIRDKNKLVFNGVGATYISDISFCPICGRRL